MSEGGRSLPGCRNPDFSPAPVPLRWSRWAASGRRVALRALRLALRGLPDPDLPFPRIDVVYYLRYDNRVKIGTSRQPRRRLASIRHDELLAFEHGDRVREQQRHRQFASAREGGEWFTLTPEIRAHIAALQRHGDPGINTRAGSAPRSEGERAYHCAQDRTRGSPLRRQEADSPVNGRTRRPA